MTTRLTINFTKERETKGAVRYEELGEDGRTIKINEGAMIGTIYIRKTTFQVSVIPAALVVTVDY